MGVVVRRKRIASARVSRCNRRPAAGAATRYALRSLCLLICLMPGAHIGGAHAADEEEPVGQQVAALIAQLDSADFAVRNDATRQLGSKGPEVLPYLVNALGDESREVRFRVQGLLAQQFAFDDVVAPLIQAVARPYGVTARTILRDRALAQIDEAGNMQFAKLLFEFWGTDIEEFRRRVTFNVIDAKGQQEVAAIVEPLMGLKDKAVRFQDLLSRLESLSLSYDHRHSPGHVVAETLAAGLRTGDRVRIEFAQRYVLAFETLTGALRVQGLSRSDTRKEISDRANMSDGASAYLVQLLDPDVPPRKILAERTHVSPGELSDEFFRGLSAVDAKECYCCVGKVHIVDMLSAVFISWPDAPRDGLVQTLCESIEATVGPGDKPKALVLLDALEACRDLSKQGLDCRAGVGQQLAHRLHTAAVIAPNIREYHPTRSAHDRFLQLLALGVTPDHAAFPQQAWQRYLRGDVAVIAEEHRLALGQYVGTVEQLVQTHAAFDQPGTQQFLTLMQDNLLADRAVVAEGAREVGRLLEALRAADRSGGAHPSLEQSLGDWAQRRKDTT